MGKSKSLYFSYFLYSYPLTPAEVRATSVCSVSVMLLMETNGWGWGGKGKIVLPLPTSRKSKQNTHLSSDYLICPVKAPCLYTISHWIWLCPTDLAGQGFDIHILAWDSSFLFYLNKNLYIYYIYTYIHCYICIYIGYVLKISSHERSCCNKMTDWEVEALNDSEAFSVDTYIFLFIWNIRLNICFLGLFFFKIKHLLHVYFKCSLFIERRKEMLCLTRFLFLCTSIKCHFIGLLPSVNRFGQDLFLLDMSDNS